MSGEHHGRYALAHRMVQELHSIHAHDVEDRQIVSFAGRHVRLIWGQELNRFLVAPGADYRRSIQYIDNGLQDVWLIVNDQNPQPLDAVSGARLRHVWFLLQTSSRLWLRVPEHRWQPADQEPEESQAPQ